MSLSRHENEQEMGASMKADSKPVLEGKVDQNVIDAIYRLRDIVRFSGLPLIRQNTLVEHCYNTGNLFVEMAKAEGLAVTQEEIMFVFRHDLLETVTGDILRPTKKLTKSIEFNWECIENEIVHTNKYSWLSAYTDFWARNHMSKKAHELFLACDLLDICYTLKNELLKGNVVVNGTSREYKDVLNIWHIIDLTKSFNIASINAAVSTITEDLYA
jgi:5'-deoxynucleotidase YfbR-like HD superfamily hydrolase